MKNLFLYQRSLHEKIGDGDNQSVLIPLFLLRKKLAYYYLRGLMFQIIFIFLTCFIRHNEMHGSQHGKFVYRKVC